jgi:hypothetical protein
MGALLRPESHLCGLCNPTSIIGADISSILILNGKKWCPGAELNHRHADFQPGQAGLNLLGEFAGSYYDSGCWTQIVACDFPGTPPDLTLDLLPRFYPEIGTGTCVQSSANWW